MNLRDIQLQIILSVQNMAGLQSLRTQVAGLSGMNDLVTKSSRGLELQNWKTVSSWDQLSRNIQMAELRSDAMFRAGMRLVILGGELTGFAKKVGGFFADAASQFGEFEFSLAKVAASSNIFTKQHPMYDKLKEAIKNTAVELKFLPVSDVEEAFYHWATTTGQTIETQKDLDVAVQGVTAAVKTAIITNTGYESAIKGAYSITKQFGLGLDDIPKVMAQLHIGTIRTSAEFNNLIESFKFVGPLAGALGISFEDAAQAISMLADQGQRGSMSGRGLAMFLTKLVKPTEDNVEAFNELMKTQLGVKDAWNNMLFKNGSFEGIEPLVNQLARATMNLTDQEKLNYLTRIASTQNAARAILPLINAQIDAFKKGADIFNDPKYSVEGALEAWRKQWELVGESWKGMTDELKRIVEVLMLSIGERVAKVFGPLVAKAAEFLKVLNEWIQANPKIMDLVVTIGAALTVAAALAGVLFMAAGLFLFFSASLSVVAGSLLTIIAPALVLLGVVSGLGAVIALNVGGIRDALGHLIDTLADLYGPLFKNVDLLGTWRGVFRTVKDIVYNAAVKVANAIEILVYWIKLLQTTEEGRRALQLFGDVMGVVLTLVPGMMGLALGMKGIGFAAGGLLILGRIAIPALMFATGIGSLVSIAKGAGEAVGLLRGLGGAVVAIGSAIVGIVGAPIAIALGVIGAIAGIGFIAYDQNWFGFRDTVDDVLGKIRGWLDETGPKVQGFLDDMSNTFETEVLPTLQDFAQKGQEQFAIFAQGVMTSLQNISDLVGRILDPVINLVNNNLPIIVGGIQSFLGSIQTFAQGIIDSVVGAIDQYIMPALQNLADAVGGFFTMLQEKLGPLLDSFMGMMSALFDNVLLPIWEFLVNTLGPAIGFVAGLLNQAFQAVLAAIQPVLDFLINAVGFVIGGIINIVAAGVDVITGIIGGGLDFLRQIFDLFAALFSGDWSRAFEIICEILRGAWDTITGIFRTALDFISDLFDGTVNFLKEQITNGLNFIHDFVQGILDQISHSFETCLQTVRDLVGGAFQFIKDTIQNALNAVHDIIWGIIDGIVNFIGGNTDKLKRLVHDAFETIRSNIQDALDKASTAVHNIIDNIVNFFRTQFDNAKRIVEDTFTKIKDFISTAINNVWTGIRTTFDNIMSTIRGFFDDASQAGQTFVSNIIDGITGFFGKLLQAGHDIFEKVCEGIRNVIGTIRDIGWSIVSGLWDGIMAAKDWIVGKIRDFVSAILPGPIKDLLGIKSPSRVMAELGGYAMEGLALGIVKNQSARRAMIQQIEDILAASRGVEAAGASMQTFGGDGLSFRTENRRVIELQIEVTSPDGSVSQLDLSRLTRELEGSSLVEALQAAAAAD